MPRRNSYVVDDEGVESWVFESGSEDNDEEGVDEGIDDMLRRMRVGDGLCVRCREAEARLAMMSCHLVVISPDRLRRWGRKQLKRWFDRWKFNW